MQKRLHDLGRRFQEMEIAQMKKGEIEARKKLEAANAAVGEKRAEFERQLRRAASVSEEAWGEVSDSLRSAWTEMKEAIDRAQEDFEAEYSESASA